MSKQQDGAIKEVAEKRALVPKLRFPEFRATEGWKSVPLSELVSALDAGVSVNSGDRPATKNEIGILKTSAVTNGIFEPQENKVVFDEVERGRVKEPVQAGTIIISRMNTPALVGANAYVETSLENIFLPDRLWAAKSKPGTSMRFVASILGSDKGRAALSKLAKGSSGSMKNITKPDVFAFLIEAPLPNEQKKIADCLSSLDELIAAQARKVDALKTHKKGLMQQLFPREGETQPRLRFPEFRDAGEWIPAELGSIAFFSSGGTPSKENTEYWNGNIPWVSASSMYELHVSKADHYVTPLAIGNGTRMAKKGTLLILVRGSMLFKRVPMCVAAVDVAFNQDVKALKVAPSVDSAFLIYQLLANESRIPINETGIGAGKIELADLKAFGVLVPSLPEQRRVADCLSNLDDLVNSSSQELEILKTHKKGLMQQLFPAAEAVEA